MKSKLLLSVMLVVSMSACTSGRHKGPKPIQLSSVRPAGFQSKSVDIDVSSAELTKAISRTNSVRKLRLVKIMKSAEGQADVYPEYRLFGILPDSPYQLLGLQNADILVAANDYVIYSPEKFIAYVVLLSKEKDGFIEIRRETEPMVLRYAFKD